MMTIFEKLIDNYGVSIRRICTEANLKYYKVLKASKAPVVGQVYDPEQVNWAAIDATLTASDKKRIEKIDWSKFEGSSTVKVQVDYDKFTVNSRWHLRVFGWVTIVYVTATHAVLILDSEPNVPRAWKLETLIINGPSETERK